MLELKSNNYEGKNKEELLNKALQNLNASKEEVLYDFKEEDTGTIFKSKKYVLNIALKQDIIEYIKNYLKDVLELMNLTVELEVNKYDDHIMVNMISNDNSILIGKNGKNIDALQTLLRQSLQTKLGRKINIILDANDYKKRKEKNLEYLSKKLAKDVKKSKVDVKMDCMNSYERRIVHNALANVKGITTKSEGEEPNRYVVIRSIEE